MIEALEHISIAMIFAIAFLFTGYINSYDLREFIRCHSLSHEHLISAKHFLQRDAIFDDNTEEELMKWYNFIFYHFSTTLNNKADDFSNDEIRHEMLYYYNMTTDSVSKGYGLKYYQFMNEKVLPKIRKFQQDIRSDIRSVGVKIEF